jgi:hypothetical protein
MNSRTYLAIDNGVTGSIAVIYPNGESDFILTPVKKEQNYTKAKGNISRVKAPELYDYLSNVKHYSDGNLFCFIERPMVNPTRFKATVSALRALEATLIVIELLGIPHQYCDSKEWQRDLLPKGCKKEELKVASKDIGCRLFPKHKELIVKHKDADALLIAEYARRKNL